MEAPRSITKMREQREWLNKLGKDPAYLYLNSLIQQQLDNIAKSCFAPSKSLDNFIGNEYNKGSFEGRCAWEMMRTTHIDVLTEDIAYEEEKVNANKPSKEDGVTNADGSDTNTGSGDQPSHAP